VRVVAVAVLLAFGAGCGGHGLELRTTPPRISNLCLRSDLLARACPRRIPGDADDPVRATLEPGARAGEAWAVLDVHRGVLMDDEGQNGPPRFVHLRLAAGTLRYKKPTETNWYGPFPFRLPVQTPAVQLDDSLLSGRHPVVSALGEHVWAGHRGRLLFVSAAGGPWAHHLMFIWRDGSHDFAVSLHAWKPISQARDALQDVVSST
jgi:hypothetical protein